MTKTNENAVLEEKKNETGHSMQLIIFKLANEEYALPIDHIKEVVLTPRISKLPQTPSYVKGVANIRGNVITIVDLEERFGLLSEEELEAAEERDEELDIQSNYTLVIESEEYKVGILVKEVPNTLSVNSTQIDNTNNIIQHSSLDEKAINGIVKLEDRMIIMVDILAMMSTGDIETENG